MTSLLETIEGISLSSDLVGILQTDISGLTQRAGGLPTQAIQNVASLAGQLNLPDQQGLFGNSATQLATLVSSGLRSPDDLWSSFTNPLSQLGSSVSGGIESPITNLFNSLNTLSGETANDPSALLGALSGPLQQIIGVLGENTDIQRVSEFIAKIQEIESQINSAPEQLATLLSDQIQAAVNQITQSVSPVFKQLEDFVSNQESRLQLNDLQQNYDAILLKLVPDGGTPLTTTIGDLDFSSSEAFAEVDGRLRAALAMLQNYSSNAGTRLTSAVDLLPSFNTEAWGQRVTSAVQTASQSEINSLASLLSSWRDALTQAQNLIADLSLENVLEPIAAFAGRIQPQLENLNLDEVKGQLIQGLQRSSDVIDTVNQAQTAMLAQFQSLSNTIQQTIDGINLDAVTVSVENALSTIDPVLTQINDSIDSVSGDVQAVLASMTSELETLQQKLTDPAGEYRAPIENFLNSINDAIPSDIPDQLENVGQQLAQSVSSLENIALDPAFDAVIEQLEAMRAELQQIDAGSLSPLLKGALAAALAVFKSFDYETEVEKFLVDKFDSAVAVVNEEGIQLIQDQVDGILNIVRSYNPSMLFDTLGITAAYDGMVQELDSFRPSDGLADIVDTINNAMDELEGLTPGKILEPIVAPLDELKSHVQQLSLDPVFSEVEQAIALLNSQLTRLDISTFIQDLNTAINQLRGKVLALLSVEGMLDFLEPIHAAVMEALASVDPAALLTPLDNVKQALIDAINAVDVSALTNTLTSISATINRFSLPQVRTNLLGKTQTLQTAINSLNLPQKFNEFQTLQQHLRSAVDARGVQGDDEAEERRQALLQTINALEPLPLLADALVKYNSLQTGITTLAGELDTQMSEGGALQQPLNSLAERLAEVGPGVDDVKQTFINMINQATEAAGIDQITDIYNGLRNTVQSYHPDNLEAALNELIAPISVFVTDLADPTAIFDEVLTAFNNLKALIDPGLVDLADQLRDQIQPILDSIIAKVNSLDPSILIGPLDAKYAEILAIKDQLQSKIQELLGALDAPYETVVETVEALNPTHVLAEPLDATYQQIIEKVDGIDIHAVFKPLFEALRALLDQLLDGIERTGDAFEAFLGAAPSVSGGAGVSL